MSNIPSELRYTKTHEWVRKDDAGHVTVGITEVAQKLLGDLVFVELPEIGSEVLAHQECSVVESVKAASDVYSPLSGEIVKVNDALSSKPDLINADPYGEGWIFSLRLEDDAELDDLLDAEAYAECVAAEGH